MTTRECIPLSPPTICFSLCPSLFMSFRAFDALITAANASMNPQVQCCKYTPSTWYSILPHISDGNPVGHSIPWKRHTDWIRVDDGRRRLCGWCDESHVHHSGLSGISFLSPLLLISPLIRQVGRLSPEIGRASCRERVFRRV